MKPKDPLMIATAESSRVFNPPSTHPYSNSKLVGWGAIGWVWSIDGRDAEVGEVVKVVLILV